MLELNFDDAKLLFFSELFFNQHTNKYKKYDLTYFLFALGSFD